MQKLKSQLQYFFTEIFKLLTNKQFILNLLGIVGFFLVIGFGVVQWLKFYTHHGQKKEIPDYRDKPLAMAEINAGQRSFQIIVNDSVHIVGKPGGLIQNQNPKAGSTVKEGRKIYVTVTKYGADVIDISNIKLYGEDFELKKRELNRLGIATNIKEWVYNPIYEEGSISIVWQDGKELISQSLVPETLEVKKGSRLDFTLYKSGGGIVSSPDIVGQTVARASFFLTSQDLNIGNITDESGKMLTDVDNAIIISQSPTSGDDIATGGFIDIVVQLDDSE